MKAAGILMVLGLAPSALANWPQWRGPSADGIAPDGQVPIEWASDRNIAWKAPLSGLGTSTPIIWGDRVFVVTAEPTGRKVEPDKRPKVDPKFEKKTDAPDQYYRFIVMCFDRVTGQKKWEKTATEKVPHEGTHNSHSYAAGSPTTDGKLLYVSFGSFGIFCYDFDGNLKWQREIGRMNTRLGWGEAVTPVVHGESVLLNWDQEADSKLVCLNTLDGKTLWETPRDEKTSWNTPLVVEHKGTTQVILNGTNRVRAYDLATGKSIWEIAGMTVNAIPSPLVKDGIAYVMSGYRGAATLQRRQQWRSAQSAP